MERLWGCCHAILNTDLLPLCHCRRAKRLKKLVKLITVDIIQSAVNSFSLKSWLLLAVLLVAHIVCFVVLVQQVDSQHR